MHSLSKLALVASYVLAATAAPVTPDASIKQRDDTSTADRCDRERWDRGHGRDDCHFRYDEGRHGWIDRWGNFHPEVVDVQPVPVPVGGPVVVDVGHCDRERWDRGHLHDDCHFRYDEGRHGWIDKWGNFHPDHKKMKREEESAADRCDGQRWDNGHVHDDCHDHWDDRRHGWVDKWGNFHPGHKKAKREEAAATTDADRPYDHHDHDDYRYHHDHDYDHRHGWVDQWGNWHPDRKVKRDETATSTAATTDADADRPYYRHDHDDYRYHHDHDYDHRHGWVDQWGNWHPDRKVKRDETATTTATTDSDRPYDHHDHDDYRYHHDHDYDHRHGWVDQWGNWHPN